MTSTSERSSPNSGNEGCDELSHPSFPELGETPLGSDVVHNGNKLFDGDYNEEAEKQLVGEIENLEDFDDTSLVQSAQNDAERVSSTKRKRRTPSSADHNGGTKSGESTRPGSKRAGEKKKRNGEVGDGKVVKDTHPNSEKKRSSEAKQKGDKTKYQNYYRDERSKRNDDRPQVVNEEKRKLLDEMWKIVDNLSERGMEAKAFNRMQIVLDENENGRCEESQQLVGDLMWCYEKLKDRGSYSCPTCGVKVRGHNCEYCPMCFLATGKKELVFNRHHECRYCFRCFVESNRHPAGCVLKKDCKHNMDIGSTRGSDDERFEALVTTYLDSL